MTAPPTPWEYDAVNNRHWDPDHGHWHDGPPPRSAPQPNTGIQPVAPETETPAPYEYDAANNRHWDPDHGHWHDGPPPATTPAEGSSAPEPTNEPAQQD